MKRPVKNTACVTEKKLPKEISHFKSQLEVERFFGRVRLYSSLPNQAKKSENILHLILGIVLGNSRFG